ncbi:MAG TPA: DUF192 domain-containing protein [Candidatus Dormibacteraeota bacterium]|nr:DUF192 domain-containing protein [Candidatus Dormibacteraeota bacterium]
MRLRNLTTGRVVAANVTRAGTPWTRLRGMLLPEAMDDDAGIWLADCWLIHTLGARLPLDVLFLDAIERVVRVAPHVRRGRVLWCRGARTVVALSAGAIARNDVLAGDRLALA